MLRVPSCNETSYTPNIIYQSISHIVTESGNDPFAEENFDIG